MSRCSIRGGKWSSSFLLKTALDSTDTRGLHDVFESVQTVLGVDRDGLWV